MSNLATTRTSETAGFAHRERREVIVENEGLGRRAARQTIHLLSFLGRPKGGDGDVLGVTTLEHGRAMHAREDADLRRNGANLLRVATIGAHAAFQHGLAVGFVLQILEDDIEVDVREFAFAQLGDQCGLGLFLEELYGRATRCFFLAKNGGGEALGRHHPLNDRTGFWRRADQVERGLRLAAESDEFLDGLDDRLDRLMSEGERFDEAIFRDLVGGAFNHQHVLFIADIDEVEGAREHLLDRRIGDELTVDLANAHGGDRAGPRNVGDGQGSRSTIDHRDVSFIQLIS